MINANLINEKSLDWYARRHGQIKMGLDQGGYRMRENGMIAYDETPYLDKL